MTPEQRIANGYSQSPDEPESNTRSKADTYRPEDDDEVARLRAIEDRGIKLPSVTKMAMGYPRSAPPMRSMVVTQHE